MAFWGDDNHTWGDSSKGNIWGADTNLLNAGRSSFGYGPLSYTPSASGSDTNYPVTNISDYKHPQRKWKANAAGDAYIILDFSSAQAVTHLFISGNINYVQIEGDDNQGNFGTSGVAYIAYRGWQIDRRVNRYKAISELPDTFNYRYMKISIPSAAIQGSSGVAEINNIFIPESIVEFEINPGFGYVYKTKEFIKSVNMESGAQERLKLGSLLQFICRFNFGIYAKSKDVDHFDLLTKNGRTEPLIFWENDSTERAEGDKSYLAYLSTDVEITWTLPEYVKTHEYRVEEVL